MAKPLELRNITIIAENDHGWRFGVAQVGDRWVGIGLESAHAVEARAAFRSEGLPVEPGFVNIFSEVSEGHELGLVDRDAAILLTGAAAQDPEACFGGIDRWFVPAELRGDPEQYRCANCDAIGGDCQCASGDFNDDDLHP